MKLFQGKSRNWIITLLLSSAAVGYVFFVFLPGQKAIGDSRQELHDKQQYIIDADRLAHAMQQTGRDLQMAHEFTQSWQQNAPAEAELAQLLAKITHQADQAGAKIVKLDRKQVARLDAVWKVPVEVHCRGDFQQVFEFISLVEKLPENIWIDQLRVQQFAQGSPSSEATKNNKTVTAEVVLTIFADNRKDSN